MNRAELLDRVNRWTRNRYGTRVTSRQLDDWVHEELVPGPNLVPHPGQRAAKREWSAHSYRSILHICRSKSRGLKTFDQLRVHEWLSGNEPLTEKVRGSMIKEFRRLYAQVYRPMRTDSGPDNSLPNKPMKRQKTIRAGERDVRLQAFASQMPDQVWHPAYDAIRFGTPFEVVPLIKQCMLIFPFLADGEIETRKIDFDLVGAGQVAEDDDDAIEGSAEHSLQSLGKDAFANAREVLRASCYAMRTLPTMMIKVNPGLADVAASFKVAGESARCFPWNLMLFTLFLHGVRDVPHPMQSADSLPELVQALMSRTLADAT